MRYYQKDVVFQEVPGEISLSYFICGCPLHCKGCHSSFTWSEGMGKLLTQESYDETLKRYEGYLTCVLFMGGEWHEQELLIFLKKARERGLKTCLYTGLEDVSDALKHNLTYLKTGPWIAELGGLDADTTNQRFIDLSSGDCLNTSFYKKTLAV